MLLAADDGRLLRAGRPGTVQSSVMLENGACVPQRDGVLTPKTKDSMHCFDLVVGKVVRL